MDASIVIIGMAFLLGTLLTTVIFAPNGFGWGKKDHSSGTLHIITTDPDGPYIFLESHIGVGELMKKEEVIFKVNVD